MASGPRVKSSSRPSSANRRPSSANKKDAKSGGFVPDADSGVFSIEELRLDFSQRDISNAAKFPDMMSQVAESFNKLITFMGGISNFDDKFRQLDILANGTRFDLDALTDRAKGFALKRESEAFEQRTLQSEAASQERVDELFSRVASLELMVPKVEDHEKRIREIENTLKTHAQLLSTHGQILEEHGERLHIREEIADQHSISILNLQGETSRHDQNFVSVQKQFDERQRSREALIASIEGKFVETNLRISQEELKLDDLKESTSGKFAAERKQTLGDVFALEKRLGSRVDSVRKEVQDNEKQTSVRFEGLESHINSEVDRLERASAEKFGKMINDVERQTRLLRKSIEENMRTSQAALAEASETSSHNILLAKQELRTGIRAFEVEVNKKVDVFRDTIKAMGPEIEDIVRRETFDVMKGHLEEYSKRLQVLIDAKVGEDVIKQELAKKADVLALGAYTKKTDSDALVSNAMGEHAKQVEIFLLNTILDNPVKSGESGGQHNGDKGGFGYEQKMRLLALESYSMKHSECIGELHQMIKNISETVDKDTKSSHYKALRARPTNYIKTRTITPLANAHGASLGYPHYVSKLALPQKLTPRPGGSVQSSARSTLQGWEICRSSSDHGHLYPGLPETSTGGDGGVPSGKAVSFATENAELVGGDASRPIDHGYETKQPEVQDLEVSEDEDEGDRTLVLDLIEEELTARGFHASNEHAVDEESADAQNMEPLHSLYESNSPLWKAAMGDSLGVGEFPITPHHGPSMSEERNVDDAANKPGEVGILDMSGHHAVDPGRIQDDEFNTSINVEDDPSKLPVDPPLITWDGSGGSGNAPPKRAGGFTFEYKMLADHQSGRAIPTSARAGNTVHPFIPGGWWPGRGHEKARASSNGHLPATLDRKRPNSAVERIRKSTATRPVMTVPGDESVREEPIMVGVNFPVTKKTRPTSAAVTRLDNLNFTNAKIGGGIGSARKGAGASLVPAPPSTSSPFAFNADAIPGTRMRPTSIAKPTPTLWFKPPAPSRALVAASELQHSHLAPKS